MFIKNRRQTLDKRGGLQGMKPGKGKTAIGKGRSFYFFIFYSHFELFLMAEKV